MCCTDRLQIIMSLGRASQKITQRINSNCQAMTGHKFNIKDPDFLSKYLKYSVKIFALEIVCWTVCIKVLE